MRTDPESSTIPAKSYGTDQQVSELQKIAVFFFGGN
jgi:hypothetical protein